MAVKTAFLFFAAILVGSCASAKPQGPKHSCDVNRIRQSEKNRLGFSNILQCLEDSNLDPCNLPQSSSQLSAQQNEAIYKNCVGPMRVVYSEMGMDTKGLDDIERAQKNVHMRSKRRKSGSSTDESTETEESTTEESTTTGESTTTTAVENGNGNGGTDLGAIIAAAVQSFLRIIAIALGFISQCIDAVAIPSDLACILQGVSFGLLAGPALPVGR